MATKLRYEKEKRNNPFYEPPLHKAFYHPTLEKELSDEKRLTALSADRMHHPPDASDIHFLKATNTYRQATGTSPGDTSSKFDESWPVSEKPSTLDSPLEEYLQRKPESNDHLSPMRPLSGLIPDYLAREGGQRRSGRPSHDLLSEIEKDADSTIMTQATTATDKTTGPSTLSKYIERFRYGNPMSREERLKMRSTNPDDFWWMNNGGQSGSLSPKNSSTPKDESGSSGSKVRSRLQGSHVRDKHRPSVSTTTDSYRSSLKRSEVDLDSDTRRLIEKTDLLLEKSESSLNSSDPVVSTVGLGSSSSSRSSSFQSTTKDQSYTRSYGNTGKENVREESRAMQRPRKPEDDILYQWRAQRRMEAMRTKAALRLGGHAQTPLAAVVADETDSRIAEIRRRVMGDVRRKDPASDPSEPRGKTTTSNQVKTPIEPDKELLHSDAFCQTSVLDEALESKAKEGTSQSDPSHDAHSPFASPSLRRKKLVGRFEEESDIQAHYHLSCDIIPCPHDHQHQHREQHLPQPHTSQNVPKYTAQHVPQHTAQHKGKQRSYHSDTDTDESQPRRHLRHGEPESEPYHDIDDDVPVKDLGPLVIDSCTDSEYETYKERHLADLQSEMSSHASSQGVSNARHDDTSKKRQDRPPDGFDTGEPSKRGEKISKGQNLKSDTKYDSDNSSVRSSNERKGISLRKNGKQSQGNQSSSKVSTDKPREQLPDKGSRKRDKSQRREDTLSESSRQLSDTGLQKLEEERKPKHSKDTEALAGRERTVGKKKREIPTGRQQERDQTKGQSSSKMVEKPKPKWSDGGQPEVKGHPRVRGQGQQRSSEDILGRRSYESYTDLSIQDASPLCHSSPVNKQRAVTPTIHKVITDRLFDDSSDDEQKRRDEDNPEITDEPVLSDGEEFPDDDLLLDLRARRLLQLERLELIDKLLAQNDEQGT